MVLVDVKLPSGKLAPFPPFGFERDEPDGPESFRVRHLITKLVRESVRDFHLREKANVFTVLTAEKIEAGVAAGKIGKPREEAQKVDLDQATGQALQAFEDGLYLLFVDEVEKRELEDLVYLNLNSKITIIRLTALAGI